MTDPKVALKVLTSEIINQKQHLEKFYAETSKCLSDMQQSISVLETELDKKDPDVS